MPNKPVPQKPPVTADEIPAEWTAMIREILQRDGQAIRGLNRPFIEVKSLTNNQWNPLGLPAGGILFVDTHERDKVMARLR